MLVGVLDGALEPRDCAIGQAFVVLHQRDSDLAQLWVVIARAQLACNDLGVCVVHLLGLAKIEVALDLAQRRVLDHGLGRHLDHVCDRLRHARDDCALTVDIAPPRCVRLGGWELGQWLLQPALVVGQRRPAIVLFPELAHTVRPDAISGAQHTVRVGYGATLHDVHDRIGGQSQRALLSRAHRWQGGIALRRFFAHGRI